MSAKVDHQLVSDAAEAILTRVKDLAPSASVPSVLTLAQAVAAIATATNTNPPSDRGGRVYQPR